MPSTAGQARLRRRPLGRAVRRARAGAVRRRAGGRVGGRGGARGGAGDEIAQVITILISGPAAATVPSDICSATRTELAAHFASA